MYESSDGHTSELAKLTVGGRPHFPFGVLFIIIIYYYLFFNIFYPCYYLFIYLFIYLFYLPKYSIPEGYLLLLKALRL